MKTSNTIPSALAGSAETGSSYMKRLVHHNQRQAVCTSLICLLSQWLRLCSDSIYCWGQPAGKHQMLELHTKVLNNHTGLHGTRVIQAEWEDDGMTPRSSCGSRGVKIYYHMRVCRFLCPTAGTHRQSCGHQQTQSHCKYFFTSTESLNLCFLFVTLCPSPRRHCCVTLCILFC